MKFLNLTVVVFMVLIATFGLLLYTITYNDLFISYTIVLNLILSFYLSFRLSPDKTRIKLSFVYLLGFSLFVCGRFFSNILGIDETYCFDFGYSYCLKSTEVIYSGVLINTALIFYNLGFILSKKNKINNVEVQRNEFEYLNYKIYYIFLLIGILCGGYTLIGTIDSIYKAIAYGYLSLYSGQVEEYSSPIDLIIMVLFNAIVALSFALREKAGNRIFYFLFFIFLINLLASVLAGSRANFVSAVLILMWFSLGENKIKLSKVIFITILSSTIFLTNIIASLSGARSASDQNVSFYNKIAEDIFYNQGITMMVFNMGVQEDSYPTLAYIKTIIPGSQIVYSWFFKVYQYDLSFSQYLMYKLSPGLFYQGYGLAWSLLGDFYAFSFGFIGLFFIYNFLWGRIIYIVSDKYENGCYYKGLYFCFLMSIFILSRFSISSFLVLIVFYFFMFKAVKFKWG